MKTATVTWITYNNYGTLLQAYALQKQLEHLGHENDILSDRIILEEYNKHKTAPMQKPRPEQTGSGTNSRLWRLVSHPRRIGRSYAARFDREAYRLPYYGSQKSCEAFKRNELRIRDGVSAETLAGLNADYDAFLCGSDQIWSVFDSIFNPYYYLDFAAKKKIAYAPSLGTDRIPEKTAERIRELLSDFDAISVRERVSAEQLRSITGKDVEWVCDPTLLHDRAFWAGFTADAEYPRGRYLLCYFLENKPWYFDCAKRIARKLRLRMRLIPVKWDYLCHEDVLRYAVGPKEFVALFQNAEYVLTDSYHGSIFSMIFEKDFMYLQRFAEEDPASQNIRIDSLFTYLGMESRLVKRGMTQLPDAAGPDYGRAAPLLQELQSRSQEYLKRSL